MNDRLLDLLGDYFISNNLLSKGWEFHDFVEFVDEWKLSIDFTQK